MSLGRRERDANRMSNFGWPPTASGPTIAGLNNQGVIHPQSVYSGSTRRCSANDARAVSGPLEVIAPSLSSRVEERYFHVCHWVRRVSSGALARVAATATQPEIGLIGPAPER